MIRRFLIFVIVAVVFTGGLSANAQSVSINPPSSGATALQATLTCTPPNVVLGAAISCQLTIINPLDEDVDDIVPSMITPLGWADPHHDGAVTFWLAPGSASTHHFSLIVPADESRSSVTLQAVIKSSLPTLISTSTITIIQPQVLGAEIKTLPSTGTSASDKVIFFSSLITLIGSALMWRRYSASGIVR